MLLFALVLPVIMGFVALSMSASMLLNAKAKLDEASLTSAIAASSDACMSSPYGFDIYACTTGNPTYPSTWNGSIPGPPFVGGPIPQATVCTDRNTGLAANPPLCLVVEHDVAQTTAEAAVRSVLQADYPNLSIYTCPDGTPASTCSSSSNVNGGSMAFQVNVSYWYYYDTDDIPATPPTNWSDTPSNDIPVASPLTSPSGGTLAPSGDNDAVPATSASTLVCPATGQAGRQVIVTVWGQYQNPFSGLIGIGTTLLQSSQTGYGCSSQK